MQLDSPQFCTPSIEHAIDRQPLMVTPETPLIDAISLMSGMSVSGTSGVQLEEEANLGGQGKGRSPNRSALACTPLGDCSTLKRSSCALVMEGRHPIGIFTERDIVRLAATQTPIDEQKIADVMTAPVISLPIEGLRDIFAALFLFRRYSIRHLPIVDRDDNLIGVVSSDGLRQVLRPTNLLKQRRVADVMTSDAIYASPTSTVLMLAQMMSQHRVSCIVIADDRDAPDLNPVGIVTERDIVQFQALGLDLGRTPAQVVMSSPLSLLEPEDSLWEAHQRMQQLRVRRLVVSWNWGRGLGIVTQTSLLRVFDPMEMFGIIETLQQTVHQLEQEQPSSSDDDVSKAASSERSPKPGTPTLSTIASSSTPADQLNEDPRFNPKVSDSGLLLNQLRSGLQELIALPGLKPEELQPRLLTLLNLVKQAQTERVERKPAYPPIQKSSLNER